MLLSTKFAFSSCAETLKNLERKRFIASYRLESSLVEARTGGQGRHQEAGAEAEAVEGLLPGLLP